MCDIPERKPPSDMGEENRRRRESRPRIIDFMAIIAGLAFSFWLFGKMDEPRGETQALMMACMILGGMSLPGPIILLAEGWRRRPKRPWRSGRILWFSTGAAAWLTWPPLIHSRFFPNPNKPMGEDALAACVYFYGTPLMAIYVTSALLFGGWIRPLPKGRKRRRPPLPWRERFGLILGLVWACTGFWVLYLIYFRSRN